MRISTIRGGSLADLGKKAEDLVGRGIEEVFPSPGQEHVQAVAHRKALAGETVRFLSNSRETGIDFDVRVQPLLDARGRVVGCLGLSLDVTRQNQARANAAEWKGRYEAAIRAAGHVLYEWRPDTGGVTYSGQVQAVLGLWPRELGPGMADWVQRIHPEDRQAFNRQIERTIQTKLPFHLSYRVARGDGRYIHVEDRGSFFLDRSGALASMVGFIVDITPQVLAQQALRQASDDLGRRVEERTASLRESEARFRLLAENSTDMIARHDAQGAFLYASPACRTLLGCEPGDLIGRTCLDLALPEDRPVIERTYRDLLASDRPQTVTFRVRHRDGSVLWIETGAHCVRDPGTREIIEIHCSSRDVTEQRIAQEQALRHQAQLAHVARLNSMGEMASGLAHELNQPLAAINNYTRGCLRRLAPDQPATPAIIQAMEAVAAQSDRAGQIIRRLRNFVSKREPIRTRADLNAIAAEAAALTGAEARQMGVPVQLELAQDLPQVLADTIQIEQVILNLIRNGLDSMTQTPAGDRRLTLRTAAEGERVVLTVQDRGRGVPVELRQRVFDPFFTTKPEGMGMGLSISKSIMQTHNGRLWLDDSSPPGAVFGISLPRHP